MAPTPCVRGLPSLDMSDPMPTSAATGGAPGTPPAPVAPPTVAPPAPPIPPLPQRIRRLADLTQNLWWSWQLDARELFHRIDHRLWEGTRHNAVEFLRQVEPERLAQRAPDDPVDPAINPVGRVNGPDGNPSLVSVTISGREVQIGAWRVMVGRVPVYLLDTDLDVNDPADRKLTARLYTSAPEWRLRQEWVLGLGGVRMLRALGLNAG